MSQTMPESFEQCEEREFYFLRVMKLGGKLASLVGDKMEKHSSMKQKQLKTASSDISFLFLQINVSYHEITKEEVQLAFEDLESNLTQPQTPQV